MKVILKSIQNFEDKFDRSAELFAFHHPYLAFLAIFIGMPIFVLIAVFIGSTPKVVERLERVTDSEL